MLLGFSLAFACVPDRHAVMRTFPPSGGTLPANGQPVLYPLADEFDEAAWSSLGRTWGYALGPSRLVPIVADDPGGARVWSFASVPPGTYSVALARAFDEPAMLRALEADGLLFSDLLGLRPFLDLLPTWTVTGDVDTQPPVLGEIAAIERTDPRCWSRGGGPGWLVSLPASEDVWIRVEAGGAVSVAMAWRQGTVVRFRVPDVVGAIDVRAVDAAGNRSVPLHLVAARPEGGPRTLTVAP